jgi:hypothetical protein
MSRGNPEGWNVPIAPSFGMGSGGKPVMAPPGGAANAIPAARTLMLPLPENEPIPDAHEFNTTGSQATAAAQANVLIAGASPQVIPAGSLFVINGLSIYITDMLTTTVVAWRVLINSAPVAGYSGLSIFPRTAPYVGNSFEPKIRGKGEALITVEFTNTDGGAYTVGASLSGWYWPEASDLRWKTYGS